MKDLGYFKFLYVYIYMLNFNRGDLEFNDACPCPCPCPHNKHFEKELYFCLNKCGPKLGNPNP